MCNKIVLQPDVAYPTQDDKQRSELLQKLFFCEFKLDTVRLLLRPSREYAFDKKGYSYGYFDSCLNKRRDG